MKPKAHFDRDCGSEVYGTHSFLHEILNRIPVEVDSLIDVGCGRGIIGALTRIYRHPSRLVGIDAFDEYLDFCARTNLYDELHKYDISKGNLPFRDREFDAGTCIEVIEHLQKGDGLKLLKELERVTRVVIISTPNKDISQKAYDDNPFQIHLSRWSPSDFTKRGYEVRGVGDLLVFGRHMRYVSFLFSRFSYIMPSLSDFIIAWKMGK
jgi:ubiquinone/menaquinone biosynthesis C-methylase UbiE